MDAHCKIGKVRLKGSRSVAKNLPLKLIRTSMKLRDELSRASTRTDRGEA